jgi:type II secretory pathway predicted ATPase ExeA
MLTMSDEPDSTAGPSPEAAAETTATAPESEVRPNADPEWPVELHSGGKAPMYGQFFGLDEPPFDLTPDPRFLFLTPHLREALSNLRYGLAASRGFTVLLGDAGTGKTTLVRAALSGLGDVASRYVLLSNPTLGRSEFYEFLAAEFRFSPQAASSKTRFLYELQQDVRERFAQGGLTGLIVDEAQSMPHALLEEIRLLGNIETTTSKLFNIVLSGQPELADRLNEPSLRQLKQRVALRCELKPLTLDEAAAYISGRLRIAGGAPEKIFTAQAVHAIHQASGGIPRSINVLCDNALVSGFAAQVKPVNIAMVADVVRDFDLGKPAVHGSAVPPVAPVSTSKHATAPTPETAAPKNDRDMFGSVQKKRSRFSFFS